MGPALARARLLALLLPVALLAGALVSQYWGGLYPCEMCHWQRWPHYAAVALALAAFAVPRAARALVFAAALAILVSGAIGLFHAGVEYGWWQGLTTCSSTAAIPAGGDVMAAILAAPLVRCDVAQWTLGGVSLAGWNALFSIGGAVLIWLLWKRPAR